MYLDYLDLINLDDVFIHLFVTSNPGQVTCYVLHTTYCMYAFILYTSIY